MAPKLTTLALAALLAVASAVLASETLVKRRVLEAEPAYAELVKSLKDYEVHDFGKHVSTRRALSSAGEKDLTYEFEVLGRRMTLALERNDALFAPGYKHFIVGENGETRTEGPLDCIYSGSLVGAENSFAAVSFCNNKVHATVHHDDGDAFTIQPLEGRTESTEHIVYRHRDLLTADKYCGLGRSDPSDPRIVHSDNEEVHRRLRDDDHGHDHDHSHLEAHFIQNLKNRDSFPLQRRNNRDLQEVNKVIGLGIVNDKRRFEQKGLSVHAHSAQLLAATDQLYRTITNSLYDNREPKFTYKLEIVSMYTFAHEDPWTIVSSSGVDTTTLLHLDGNGELNADSVLKAFEAWRAAPSPKGLRKPATSDPLHGHDLAHLLTGYTFTGGTIGLAYLERVCASDSRSGITQAAGIPDAFISSTIAHEVGHNLGAKHTDQTPPPGFSSCHVADGKLIMSSSSSSAGDKWDKCSVEYFRKQFTERYGTSIWSLCAERTSDPNGLSVWDGSAVCGDGLRQGSEECDCINNDCTGLDPCCDGATCKLLSGKQCSALDGCCDNCQIRNDTSHVCRPAISPCDITETCDGVSGRCPFDLFNETGVPCTTPKFGFPGTCYSKQCLDMSEECTERGLMNGNQDKWTEQCPLNADVSTNTKECEISCKGPLNGGCRQYGDQTFFADGTQCNTGRGCYLGQCIPFDEIPVLNNPNCTNGLVDQNETDLDCGGPNCFGCTANKYCLVDKDCIFPGFCNKTELFDANGHVGLGRCSATGRPSGGDLEELLNKILDWFRKNPQIWGPILGGIVLLLLLCCCWPRGSSRQPLAKQGMLKAQSSFSKFRGGGSELPTAVVVKAG